VDIPPFGNKLHRPWYVITMGWRRWGLKARIKWAKELRSACKETVNEIDFWLAKVDH
jgi:hypothetical protein